MYNVIFNSLCYPRLFCDDDDDDDDDDKVAGNKNFWTDLALIN
jgi:hypothetical protein